LGSDTVALRGFAFFVCGCITSLYCQLMLICVDAPPAADLSMGAAASRSIGETPRDGKEEICW
jgi:hypothetical protein